FLCVCLHQDWRFERFSGSNRFYRQNMKGADCNLDIMPPRKKQNKRSNKLNLKKRTLSKSQKLKLKRLEEDREKELLSAKNSDLLNKYKIYEDVSSLLQLQNSSADLIRSWRNAGDQCSKAGVLSDEPVKEIHIPALQSDSDQLIHPNELDSKVMMISS
ncbi:unnamed protein product, partial [Brassica rapa]